MGLGRGLVTRVFCRSKSSIGTYDNSHQHHRNFGVDKSRWNSVRLYLCGDELNSVLVENDSSSVRSTFETISVIQPIQEDHRRYKDEVTVTNEDEDEDEEKAATIIQSAFRGFMARQRYQEMGSCSKDDGKGVVEDYASIANEAASIEVLVDDSTTENFTLVEGNGGIQQRVLHKSPSQVYRLKEEWDDSTLSSDTQRLRIQNRLEATTRRERALAYAFSQQEEWDDSTLSSDTQRLRIQNRLEATTRRERALAYAFSQQEEWDDSTLSSDTQRLRIQNRLEATTRRERALAYAFSQQLRICATKKKPTWSDSTTEPYTGWSWLERWMATKVPENLAAEKLEPIISDRRLTLIAKKRLDLSFEGKESCGSNDVPVNFEGSSLPPSQIPGDKYGQVKNKLKASKSVSRRKTVPEYHRPLGSTKINRRVYCKEAEEKRHNKQQVQPGRMAETKSKD